MPVRTRIGGMAGSQLDDPLERAIAPPPGETDADRAERLRAADEARRISNMIDEELNRQRAAEKKGPRPVKVLLLGQSESGKSTTLKNFQLMNSPKAFHAESASWRAVVQLNVVRSVRLILDALLDACAVEYSSSYAPPTPPPSSPPPPTPSYSSSSPPPISPVSPPARTISWSHSTLTRRSTLESTRSESKLGLTSEHVALRNRLLPLIRIEALLASRLAPGAYELESPSGATRVGGQGYTASRHREVAVSAGSSWKSAFAFTKVGRGSTEVDMDVDDQDEPTRVLYDLGPDMIRLWRDPSVRALLKAQKLRLEEMPGFFLDSLERITALGYIPTVDDILRARLKTLGVTEYRFTMNTGNALSHNWRVYDVGGQRSLRAAWVPFFDDMNAIIFLAPVSCFDQVLAEDNNVNRLEDSVLLWRSVTSNPLLARTNLVLFLNKCDVLRSKLAAGIRLAKYVVSFGDRPNEFKEAMEYLKRKFASIHKDHSPATRQFICHYTSVTDTKATSVILDHVTENVIRGYLQRSSLL